MKKIVAFILLLSVAVQTFSQGITVLDFYIHRAFIAKTQCENRFRPMLHCNGKCVLAKKLKLQEKKEEQNQELKMPGKFEVLSSRSFFTQLVFTSLPPLTFHLLIYTGDPTDRSSEIFHPPCA